MRISATPSFLKRANKLFKKNPAIKKSFKSTINKMIEDPHDPSIKTHKLKGALKEFRSCTINYEMRIRFRLTENAIELIDIGAHDEVY